MLLLVGNPGVSLASIGKRRRVANSVDSIRVRKGPVILSAI